MILLLQVPLITTVKLRFERLALQSLVNKKSNLFFYRQMQEVQLDKHIRLLDSPGVVMATDKSDTSVILRNCVQVNR
jgi:hypothetical protein